MFHCIELKSGQPSLAYTVEKAKRCYEEMPIFQNQPFDDYWDFNSNYLANVDRLEYISDVDGSWVICSLDYDPHVGPCILVMTSYSFGDNLTPVFRDLKRVAKQNNVNWLCLTNHIRSSNKSHEYRTTYRRV